MLLQDGLIKFLFATEIFALGVTMPARTVLWTLIPKLDEQVVRLLNTGEYAQMNGHAGLPIVYTNTLSSERRNPSVQRTIRDWSGQVVDARQRRAAKIHIQVRLHYTAQFVAPPRNTTHIRLSGAHLNSSRATAWYPSWSTG